MKKYICAYMFTVWAIATLADMHQQQPNISLPPPLPPPPSHRPGSRATKVIHWNSGPQWPAKTNFLTLTNLTYITNDGKILMNIPSAEFKRLLQEYPDDVVRGQTIRFY